MTDATHRINIRHLTKGEITSLLAEWGEPSFRANQIWQWLWQKGVTSISQMTNLSQGLRKRLEEEYTIFSMEPTHIQHSEDGTIKVGFTLFDGNVVEGVIIPQGDRSTACISSQVGCSLSCAFCATGRLQRMRNLYFDEIVDQVFWLNSLTEKHFDGRRLSNIVFMGMGEPLLNFKQVVASIERITAEDGLGFSPKRITVSTAGIPKGIEALADLDLGVGLALSLHAPNDKLRSSIMPINDYNDISRLIEALRYFNHKTGQRITLEYVMLGDVNDQEIHAQQLAAIAKSTATKVNLIQYNPIGDPQWYASSGNAMHRFQNTLRELYVISNLRRSRGKDIDAACGQLANKNLPDTTN